MYGPGSSKKNGVGGLNRKLPFLNVHNNWQKKGEVSSLTYIIEISLIYQWYTPILLPPVFFFFVHTTKYSCMDRENIKIST